MTLFVAAMTAKTRKGCGYQGYVATENAARADFDDVYVCYAYNGIETPRLYALSGTATYVTPLASAAHVEHSSTRNLRETGW